MFRWFLRWRFAWTGRLILRNTNRGESDYTKQSKDFCGHDGHRKQTGGLESIHSLSGSFDSDHFGRFSVGALGRTNVLIPGVTSPRPPAREIAASALSERVVCATMRRDAGPDSGMPQMGGGRLCCRLCPDEIIRGQSYS